MQTIINEILAEVRVLELTKNPATHGGILRILSRNELIELAASCVLQLKKTSSSRSGGSIDPNQLQLDLK